jgi:metal-responsive CopG/Arc/MetJ family transcriptional regulator
MSLSKTRISVTIIHQLAKMLEEIAQEKNVSKSSIVETALHDLIEEKMAKDAKKLASIKFDDLPTEDEWIEIQSKF